MSHDCFISAPYIFNGEMMERFRRAGDLTMQYNQTSEGQQEIRQSILAQLLGKQGKDVLIIPGLPLSVWIEYHT